MQRAEQAPPLRKAVYVRAKFFDKLNQQSVRRKARAVVLRFYCFCKDCRNGRVRCNGRGEPLPYESYEMLYRICRMRSHISAHRTSPTKAVKCCAGFAECKTIQAHTEPHPTKSGKCQCKNCTIDIKTGKRSPDRERERTRKERCEWLKR